MSDVEVKIGFSLVLKFFGGDINKAYKWWHTDNPMLGNVAPVLMVDLGRETKLLKFIKQQIAGNEP